jgi:selenocysteine lyase/cysteine desulfurase
MGTGLLLCREDRLLTPLYVGGTGNASLSPYVPEELPERLESGTPNVAGFAGLGAGLRWLRRRGVASVAAHEREIALWMYERLEAIRGLRLCSPSPRNGTAVISLTSEQSGVAELADRLGEAGFAVRGGLHCAPGAHRFLGTLEGGAVRVSPGLYNTRENMFAFVHAVHTLMREKTRKR